MANFEKTRRFLQRIDFRSRKLQLVLGVLVVALIVGGISTKTMSSSSVLSAQSNKTTIADAKSTQNLNRDFDFPLKDDKGADVGKVKFTLENAELRDEIIVKGRRATAIKGKTFLIINLKIANDTNNTIGMDTRNYIRLSVNGNDKELLAPDIHNDPVVIQAISTKQTRVGFPIAESDKKLKLIIGEVKGEKTNIELNLK